MRDMSVSVSVLNFLKVSPHGIDVFFYRTGDDDHTEDDEKCDSKWLQNFSLLSVNNLVSRRLLIHSIRLQ